MIPPAVEWPVHRDSKDSNLTKSWHGSDSEAAFVKHYHNPHTRQILNKLGWTEDSIIYELNEQGFRSIPFDPTLSAGMALGCSMTQGEGLLIEQTWPSVVSQKINQPIYNLGVGGCSMDTMFRLAEYWIPVLKPKFVLLAGTFAHRTELCCDDGTFINLSPFTDSWLWQVLDQPTETLCRDFYKAWIMNTQNGEINYRKNLLAIRAVCNQFSIPLIDLNVQYNMSRDNAARDLQHPGPLKQIEFAEKMLEKMKGIV